MNPQRLRALFCDHLNLARGKILAPGKIADGSTRLCQGIFALGYDKGLVEAPGSTLLEGLPDMELRYRPEDVRAGWSAGTKLVVCDLHDSEGVPLALCPRGALKRAVADWRALGLDPVVGLELEAYAFERRDDGRLVPYETPGAYVYGTGPLVDPRGVTDAIWEKAAAAGFCLESMTSEFDSPQFEFTLAHGDAVQAVDDLFLFRLLARETALAHGIVLTFVPKPILEKSGCGVHVNLSFRNRDGSNVLSARDGPGPGPVAHGAIAGLLHHHAALAGLIAPCANSYQRLRPASLSGYWRNWGGDHRGVTTRLPSETGPRARLEHRMGDGAANPYTLVAAVLQAARLGLANAYPLPPRETGDGFHCVDAKDGVAADLGGAIDALAADQPLIEAVGAGLCRNHIAIKRQEAKTTAGLSHAALVDFYIPYL